MQRRDLSDVALLPCLRLLLLSPHVELLAMLLLSCRLYWALNWGLRLVPPLPLPRISVSLYNWIDELLLSFDAGEQYCVLAGVAFFVASLETTREGEQGGVHGSWLYDQRRCRDSGSSAASADPRRRRTTCFILLCNKGRGTKKVAQNLLLPSMAKQKTWRDIVVNKRQKLLFVS